VDVPHQGLERFDPALEPGASGVVDNIDGTHLVEQFYSASIGHLAQEPADHRFVAFEINHL
jgi:hypothetical protein